MYMASDQVLEVDTTPILSVLGNDGGTWDSPITDLYFNVNITVYTRTLLDWISFYLIAIY